ncbi:hypothetical protein D3C78_1064420 [compost metagenome]
MQGQHAQVRGEARRLVLPVGDQAGRHHYQCRAVHAAGFFLGQDVGQGLQSLAQAHVVAEDTADAQLTQGLHPAQTLQLIGAQVGVQAGRRRAGLGAVAAQPPGEVAQAFATLPFQRYFVEIAQACGIRHAQAQRNIRAGTQVELAERGEDRTESGKGQADMDRLLVGVAVCVERYGDAAVRLCRTTCQQLGMRADRADQHGQQADPSPFDENAEFEIEPAISGAFFDGGEPAIHRRDFHDKVRLRSDIAGRFGGWFYGWRDRGGAGDSGGWRPGLQVEQHRHAMLAIVAARAVATAFEAVFPRIEGDPQLMALPA